MPRSDASHQLGACRADEFEHRGLRNFDRTSRELVALARGREVFEQQREVGSDAVRQRDAGRATDRVVGRKPADEAARRSGVVALQVEREADALTDLARADLRTREVAYRDGAMTGGIRNVGEPPSGDGVSGRNRVHRRRYASVTPAAGTPRRNPRGRAPRRARAYRQPQRIFRAVPPMSARDTSAASASTRGHRASR